MVFEDSKKGSIRIIAMNFSLVSNSRLLVLVGASTVHRLMIKQVLPS
jgi:hypothetical protein